MGKNIKNKIMGVITQISLTNNVICRCLEDWQSRTLGRRLLSGCDALALPTTVLSNHWSPPILFTVYIHITITAPSCLLPFGPQIWFYFTCTQKSYIQLKLTTLLLSLSDFSHEKQHNFLSYISCCNDHQNQSWNKPYATEHLYHLP